MTAPYPPLPLRRPPFAVRDLTRIQADLYPMGSEINGHLETGHFVADEDWERDIATKLDLLEQSASLRHLVVEDDPAGLAEAQWRTAGLIAIDQPTIWQAAADGAWLPRLGLRYLARTPAERIEPVIDASQASPLGHRIAAWLATQHGVNRLVGALALAVQEDIVVMRILPDDSDICESLQVCFPSGWDPREKCGRSFAAIHIPVADSERLVKSSANVMRAMVLRGPYLRFTFGLSRHGLLDNHPVTRPIALPIPDAATIEEILPELFVRMERQTTHPFADLGRALFTIRIYTDPLLERINIDPGLRPRIASLVRSASPDVSGYKGYAPYAERLIAWLDAGDTPSSVSLKARYHKTSGQ